MFKESVALRTLVNKKLRGTRCRAINPVSESDKKATRALSLRPLHSFQNASAVAEVLGWRLVKGFLVLQRLTEDELEAEQQERKGQRTATPMAERFVAVRHWWNARDDGAWVDLTPPILPPLPGGDARALLVESERGEKDAAPLSEERRAVAVAIGERIINASSNALVRHIMAGGQLPEAMGGKPAEAGAEATGGSAVVKRRDASRWSSFDNPSKWDTLDLSDDDEPKQPTAAQRMEADVKAAVEKAKAEQAAIDPEKEHRAQLDETTSKIKRAGLGMTTMTKDDRACSPCWPRRHACARMPRLRARRWCARACLHGCARAPPPAARSAWASRWRVRRRSLALWFGRRDRAGAHRRARGRGAPRQRASVRRPVHRCAHAPPACGAWRRGVRRGVARGAAGGDLPGRMRGAREVGRAGRGGREIAGTGTGTGLVAPVPGAGVPVCRCRCRWTSRDVRGRGLESGTAPVPCAARQTHRPMATRCALGR